MKYYNAIIAALIISIFFFPIANASAQADLPVVRAVLFYSATCGHCELVINETLVPLVEKYGEQLQIIAIEVNQPGSQALFGAAMQKFGLERAGVPFLVFDDTYLIGSVDIPEKFPGLVESYLAQGGLDWPDIPGLREAMGESPNTPTPTATPAPIVHAVLFHQSTCDHCRKIVEEVVPPLVEKYGTQLQIFRVDISSSEGNMLYDAAIERFKIEKFGVPTMIVGDQVLVGATEIEEKFASISEGYINQGGVGWPEITGLPEAIAKAPETEVAAAIASTQSAVLQTTVNPGTPASTSVPPVGTEIALSDSHTINWQDNFTRDPAGNTLAVIVLAGMLVSVVWAVVLFQRTNGVSLKGNWAWIIPILCLAGFGVAGYLAYVETTQIAAVCGPVGDCNTVQQSEYARLFGVLPIGILGLLGYIAITTAWLFARYGHEHLGVLAALALFAMTVFGTVFSIYLTFLEPFVIGATCAWCLTSSVLMTLLMLLSVRPAKLAFSKNLFNTVLLRKDTETGAPDD
jgi:uncharacterized membrane protein/thiol-disulfide isomerase/thioredoxin